MDVYCFPVDNCDPWFKEKNKQDPENENRNNNA